MELNLHPIHPDAIQLALDKARQYRSLHEAEIAESICLDILHIQPLNQKALMLYILSLSDQLRHADGKHLVHDMEAAIAKLQSPYQRLYHTGLMHERRARAMLGQGMTRAFAYDDFVMALKCYRQAEAMRPAHNDETILRWNSCIRTIEKEKLRPRPDAHDARLDMES